MESVSLLVYLSAQAARTQYRGGVRTQGTIQFNGNGRHDNEPFQSDNIVFRHKEDIEEISECAKIYIGRNNFSPT
jgi:hypothetical protein